MIELNINDRAFNAIRNGTKKIEIRVNKINSKKDYGKINENDIIEFRNSIGDKINCRVIKNKWYKSIEELLVIEGTQYTLSSTNDFEKGIASINSIDGYKEGIMKNGVFAIHLEYLNENLNS